jgi:hypothetical protein
MAKIYETKDDFVRDKLHEQSSDLRLEAEKQSHASSTFLVASGIAEMFRLSKPEKRGWLSYVSWAAIAGSVISMIQSWGTASKAHNLELEADRMGPQRIVLPADVAPLDADQTFHSVKHTLLVEPKTLEQHAETSCGHGHHGKM